MCVCTCASVSAREAQPVDCCFLFFLNWMICNSNCSCLDCQSDARAHTRTHTRSVASLHLIPNGLTAEQTDRRGAVAMVTPYLLPEEASGSSGAFQSTAVQFRRREAAELSAAATTTEWRRFFHQTQLAPKKKPLVAKVSNRMK